MSTAEAAPSTPTAEGKGVAEQHPSDCQCLACDCRSWLRYSHVPDRPAYTLKIATYGSSSRGTGEPDRAYDQAVRDADFARALAEVGKVDPYLGWLGRASRAHPPRKYEPHRYVFRLDQELIDWLSVTPQYAGWSAARVKRLTRFPGESPWRTLTVLLDDCARAMALQMGQLIEGELRRPPPEVKAEKPTDETTEDEWRRGRQSRWAQRVGARKLLGHNT